MLLLIPVSGYYFIHQKQRLLLVELAPLESGVDHEAGRMRAARGASLRMRCCWAWVKRSMAYIITRGQLFNPSNGRGELGV